MDIKFNKSVVLAYSLVELLAVATIVSIIAAFSIPSYMQYLTETKINYMWQLADAPKLAMQTKYLKNRINPTTVTSHGYGDEYNSTAPTTDYIRCISIENGVVLVLGQPSAFNNENIWVAWTPSTASGVLTWSCSYSADAAQYIGNTMPNCNQEAAPSNTDPACF